MNRLFLILLLGSTAIFGYSQGTSLWTFDLPKTKGYTLVVTLNAGPEVKGEVWSDGVRLAKFAAGASQSPREVEVPAIFLTQGSVTLELRTKTGPLPVLSVTYKDSLRVHTDPIRSVPTDPDATPEARKLLEFLVRESGKHILAGQQDLTWNDEIDMVARVKAITGKEPALVGFDFLNYVGSSPGSGRHQTQEALAWARRGGLVAFCWHWRVGTQREFYSNRTDFRIPDETDKAAWASLDDDIDVVAAELKILQDAGVAVLWRPLHEASGGWFWWGASGAAAYKTLWNHVWERLVTVRGLHNLLWVWNGQNDAWYPGDARVDIVG